MATSYDKCELRLKIYGDKECHDMVVVIDYDKDDDVSVILTGEEAKELVNTVLSVLGSKEKSKG